MCPWGGLTPRHVPRPGPRTFSFRGRQWHWAPMPGGRVRAWLGRCHPPRATAQCHPQAQVCKHQHRACWFQSPSLAAGVLPPPQRLGTTGNTWGLQGRWPGGSSRDTGDLGPCPVWGPFAAWASTAMAENANHAPPSPQSGAVAGVGLAEQSCPLLLPRAVCGRQGRW